MSNHLPSQRFLALAIVGYGLHIALVSLVGWPGSSSVFTQGFSSSGVLSPFSLAKDLAFCLSFLVWFAVAMRGGERFYALFSHRPVWWVFSAAFVAAGVGASLAVPSGCGTVPEVLCGALMGVSLSGNFTLWQRTLCARHTPVDARGLIGGTILGGSLFFLTSWLPDQAVRVIALAVMAPATSAVLMLCNVARPGRVPLAPDHAADLPDLPARRANLRKGVLALIMPCVTIGAIGFTMQALRIVSVGLGAQEALLSNLYNIANVIGPSVLLLVFERNRYHVDMGVFYRIGAPLIGGVALLFPVGGAVFQNTASVLLYATFSIASIMGILACNQVSRQYRVPPIAMYALCFATIYLVRFSPVAVWGLGLFATGDVVPVALVCLALMFACYVASDRFQCAQEVAQVYSWESELAVEAPARASEDAVRAFGESRGLTVRECEVLLLMQTGRSAPAIAEKIGVSQNTVRFHAKNLYSKLGIHSRQELIDLVDKATTQKSS